MNSKIKNYVDVLFGQVPKSKKGMELKEEILSNLSDRFEGYMAEGKNETQAYTMAVSNMGDFDNLIAELMPDEKFRAEANKYRERKARNTAGGVALYIIGPIFLIVLASIGDFLGMEDMFGVLGVSVMLMLIAVATGLIIYTNMSIPPEYKEFAEEERNKYPQFSEKSRVLYKGMMSVYWSLVTLIYLVVSFFTGAWAISWIIWVIASIISEIISTLIRLRDIDE